METNDKNIQEAGNTNVLVTEQEREQFLMRRGWKYANAEGRKELSEHWNDSRIRMALDMGLG
ncbi:hypothetical protein [Glutamicibacter ardleyensis]|uniref:hypothetical protein n=1 Tax=Glutamicibacter ardleyensis TaxID=225894 RepID=UPI003FD17C83